MDLPMDHEEIQYQAPCHHYEQQMSADEITRFKGDSCYFDMGIFYGYVQSNLIQWWPEPVQIKQPDLDSFLNKIFTQLKACGTNKIELSFAQLCDIDALLAEQGGVPSDKITDIFKDNYPVGSTGENLLMYLNKMAHENDIEVDLSFGGSAAGPSDWKINGDPATQANNLVEFLDNYDFDSVDFDIEGSGVEILTVNPESIVLTFFKTLHEALSKEAKESIITLAGSIQDGPGGTLAPLFQDFESMFDGVNLMLYSNTQYYIDANNPTWGLEQWLTYLPGPSDMHIGFYDAIPYENPSASGGEQYDIPSRLTRGQAAAWIYLHVLGEMKLEMDQVGNPFWWTDDPTKLPSNKVLQHFYEYLTNPS